MSAFADTPLLSADSSNLWSNKKVRLEVFEDRVELTTRNLIGQSVQSVRREQVAAVRLDEAIFYTDLIIETRGEKLLARGLNKKQAREAADLIKSRRQPVSGEAGVVCDSDVQLM